MRKLLFLIISIGIQFCFPQSNKNVEKGLFKLNALSPGASYELGVGRNATFNFGATVLPYIEEEFQNGFFEQNEEFVLELYPALRADFRYFVNMKRRIRKGKDITRNSGNYVALENQMILAAPIFGQIELDEPFGYSFRIAYGIQRTYGKGFYWGLGFGLGPTFLDNTIYTSPVLTTHLGWVISKSKK